MKVPPPETMGLHNTDKSYPRLENKYLDILHYIVAKTAMGNRKGEDLN